MRSLKALSAFLALLSLPVQAAGPTGLLNDTGVSACLDGSDSLAPCVNENTGDTGTYPRQDGRFGRDAAATAGTLTKVGGGVGGFDFTALDATGSVIPLAADVPSIAPACVKDNLTQLIWEVKTASNASAAYHVDDDHPERSGHWSVHRDSLQSGSGLCGYTTGWRLPTRRELLSIVHRDRIHPVLNTNFFPDTLDNLAYWTSDYVADGAGSHRWRVSLYDGTTDYDFVGNAVHVLLVRNAE